MNASGIDVTGHAAGRFKYKTVNVFARARRRRISIKSTLIAMKIFYCSFCGRQQFVEQINRSTEASCFAILHRQQTNVGRKHSDIKLTAVELA